MTRVLLIGIDGATWDLIKPWINEGKLPTLKRKMDEGVHGQFMSTIPSNTIPAWNSLASGKNPGKYGVITFMSRDPWSYQFKLCPFKTEGYLWEILSDNGKRVIVVNVPCVHSASKINGLIVVGWLYRGKEALTYPRTLKKRLDELVGGYEIDVMDLDLNKKATVESIEIERERVATNQWYVERVFEIMNKRLKAILFLLDEKWDFAFVVFVAPDRLQHRFWANKEIVFDCYRRLDGALEKILTKTDEETTLMIVSDHGFGPKKRIFSINEWLLNEGYLKLKYRPTSMSTKVENILRKIGTLSLVRFLANHLPKKMSKYIEEKGKGIPVESANIDWTKTKIFTSPSPDGGLYLNVKGREEEGIIDPDEYEHIRNEIIQKLRNLKDTTTGEKVSAEVYKREEIYEGKYVERAPDLVIQINDEIQAFNLRVGHGQIFFKDQGGAHRKNGIFLAHGPEIREGIEIEGVKMCDVFPTVLHVLNMPVPKDVDGRVLKEIFRPESQLAKKEIMYHLPIEKVEKEEVWQKEEEGKVKERLRRLGYI